MEILEDLIHQDEDSVEQSEQGSNHVNEDSVDDNGFNFVVENNSWIQDDEDEIIDPRYKLPFPPQNAPKPGSGPKMPTFQSLYGNHAIHSKPSIESRIKSRFELWAYFCHLQGRSALGDIGLGLLIPQPGIMPNMVQNPNFNQQQYHIDYQLMCKFLQYCGGLPRCNRSYCETLKLFLQTHLNLEAKARGIVDLSTAGIVSAISKNPDIKRVTQLIQEAECAREYHLCIDLLANVDNRIGFSKKRELIMSAFIATSPQYDRIKRMHPLNRVQFAAMFVKAIRLMARGDDIRRQLFCHNFLRTMDTLGPAGMEVNFCLRNGGKTNKVGRRDYSPFAPHINPLLDGAAMDGICMLQRFVIEKEPFPSFDNLTDYARRYLYRSSSNHNAAFPEGTMQHQWSSFFESNGVLCDSVCHQPRREEQQNADEAGLPLSSLERHVGYASAKGGNGPVANRSQTQSYITNPPIDATAFSAGSDHRSPRCHVAGWVVEEKNDSLIDAFIPMINITRNQEWAKYHECTKYEQLVKGRLFQSTGCIDAIRDMVWKALCMLASRPHNFKTGKLEKESPIILVLFQEDPRMMLFRHPAFMSSEFLTLTAKVKEQQDQLDEIKLTISPHDQKEIENWLCGFVVEPLQALFSLYQGMDHEIKQLKNSSHLSEPANLPAVVTQLGTNSAAPSFTSVFEVPSPAIQDHCVNGNIRRRKRSVTKQDRARLAHEHGMYGPAIQYASILAAPDHNTSLRDYWNQYKHGSERDPPLEWLETSTQKKWRQDIKLIGVEKKACASRVWWNIRIPIYNLMLFYIDTLGMSEEVAVQEAEQVFSSIPISRKTKKRPLKKVSVAFKIKLKSYGEDAWNNRHHK